MIKLKNIKKNYDIIECDIIPENSSEHGHIRVDLKRKTLMDSVLPAGYEWCTNHIQHAASELIDLSKAKELPEEKLVIWY